MTAGRYVGLEVARAAHLAAAGHGGQILLSHEAVDEVAKHGQEFPPDTELRYLGTHRLGDLATRESIIQLMLPDTSGLPPQFPSLRTLDLWPVARANLVTVAMLTLVLLTLAGLALPVVVPTFPRALGWVAGAAILALFGLAILARPAPHSLARQWREIRRPFATIISVLPALVVVLTMLFITRAPILIASHGRSGYDFHLSVSPPHTHWRHYSYRSLVRHTHACSKWPGCWQSAFLFSYLAGMYRTASRSDAWAWRLEGRPMRHGSHRG